MLDALERAAEDRGWRVSRIDGSHSASERQARRGDVNAAQRARNTLENETTRRRNRTTAAPVGNLPRAGKRECSD